MKRLILSILAISILISLSGCSTQRVALPFDPGNKHIVFLKGIPYYIPYGSMYATTPISEAKIKRWHDIGLFPHAKSGDLWWIEPKQFPSIRGNFANPKIQQNMLNAFRNNLFGYSSPLTDQEYQYYLNKKNMILNRKNKQSSNNNSNSRESTANGNSALSEFNNSLNQLNNYQRQQNANTQNYINNGMYDANKNHSSGLKPIIKSGNMLFY